MEYLGFYILGFVMGIIAAMNEKIIGGKTSIEIDHIEDSDYRNRLKCHWWTSTILYGTFIIACFGEAIWLLKTLFSFI